MATQATSAERVTCPNCGRKNRVPAAAAGVPRCGNCHQPLPWIADAGDDSFAEVMFSAAVWSSNQDKLRPKVSCITRLAHPVDGHSIPGSRWGIDNPDSVYRVIPISGEERYEIRGRVGQHRMTENYFTLWDANMGTVDVLNGSTMAVDPDGSFTITGAHTR